MLLITIIGLCVVIFAVSHTIYESWEEIKANIINMVKGLPYDYNIVQSFFIYIVFILLFTYLTIKLIVL